MAKPKAKNILSLIQAEHHQVEQLFAAAEQADNTKMYKCFNQIYEALSLHNRAEEQVFYAAMRKYEETNQYVEEAEKEHKAAKALLEEIQELKPTDSEFRTKMSELKKSFQQHVGKEESEIFKVIRKCMNEEELTELGQEFQEAKVKLEADIKVAMTEEW
ncbi:MAG: hemerythrin domain-containing protein [Stigonema ocellatum SAG 48.90 = DSM 106950]|nr:hemerythrin domain-containing protein [Stigonema ocellatum SAG 48.90 = DSM 106950]